MDASPASPLGNVASDRRSASRRPAIRDGISLVLIAGADATATRSALTDAQGVLSGLTNNYEILVVGNATSNANTRAAMSLDCGHDARVRFVSPDGAGFAGWQQGVRQAAHDWVVLAPADGRYRLAELGRLLAFTSDSDVVCGYRIGSQRRLIGAALDRCGAHLSSLLLRTAVRDPGCELKIFRRSLLGNLPELPDDDFSRVELLARLRLAGAQIVEVPTTYQRGRLAADTPTATGLNLRGIFSGYVARPGRWLARLVSFWWSQFLFAQNGSSAAVSTAETPWRGGQAVAAWCVLAGAAIIFFFSHLSFPLLEPDESRYARIAQEMIRTGDYLVPYRFGEPYLDKPPMLYWLTAASYRLFGVSEGAARVVCALSGLIAVLATYGIGRRLIGQRAAWIGAFTLMLCTGFALGGKFLIMDGLLTCFVTLAMLSGYLAIHGPRVRPGWCVAASLFCGLGVMTKGPLAVVLFLPPLIASRWLTKGGAKLTWRHWALCLAPGALVALPWFVLVTLREPQFLEYFFWRHHVARFTTDFSHDQPWWYYIPVLLLGMFPASLLLGPLAILLFGNDAALRRHRTWELGYLLLVAGWILFFFTLSRGKLPPYIIPALPPMCLLCGKLLDLLVARTAEGNLFRRSRAIFPELVCQVALAGVAVVGVIDLALGGGRNYGFLVDSVLILAGASLFFYLPRGNHKHLLHNWAAAGVLAWVAMAYAFLNFYPDIAYSRSIAVQAEEICEEAGDPKMPIIFFGRREESVLFYLPANRIHEFAGKHPDRLVAFLRRHPKALLVSDRNDIADLRPSLPAGLTVSEMGGRGHLYLATTPAANVASGDKPTSR